MKSYTEEKKRLREFLDKRSIVIKKNILRCPNPSHEDVHPSAVLYDNEDIPRVYCPVCDESWSVFEVAGFYDNLTEFSDKLKSVRNTLNITDAQDKKEKTPLPFPENKRDEFNKKIESLAQEKGWGDIKGSWKYKNKNGQVVALDVRFEKEGQRKNVITFWYDGKFKWYGSPVFIYNLDEVYNDDKRAICIFEGAKCAERAKILSKFIPISWSGGSAKVNLVDWKFLENRKVYLLPDDDDPGIKACEKIRRQIPHAITIGPHPHLKQIKETGADIEELLQIMSPEEITEYIESFDAGPSNPPEPHLEEPPPRQDVPDGPVSDGSMPFKILGIGSDGKAAFITEAGRFEKYTLESLSKNKLMVLANRYFWVSNYSNDDNKMNWDKAIDGVIRKSQHKDFDESQIRGRGAWHDGDKISYHDGVNTYGEYDKKKIYLRLPKRDIGINTEPIKPEIAQKIKNTVMQMSFETPADAVRCLAWSIIAPFAGALKIRPALLMTGPSGSGKSTVEQVLMRKLTAGLRFTGNESTPAFIRQTVYKDSVSIILDETEAETEKQKNNRRELFALMRTSTSDDSPEAGRGGADGKPISFKMQNIFCFIAIDPTVESIADENRIFRINMIKPTNGNNWKNIEKELMSLLSEKNCQAIRALTWNKLKIILDLSERIVDSIRNKTGRDYRSSFSDAMLAAAFMVVWAGNDNPSDEQIENMLTKYYSYQPPEEHRDEAEEIIDRIMDEQIEILGDGMREKITIMECLNRIYNEHIDLETGTRLLEESAINLYKQHVSRVGVRVLDDGNIAIVNNHHVIKRIIQCGNGYNKLLKRHPGFVEGQRNVYFYGKSPRCTIISGVIKKKYADKTDDEKLGELFE